MWGPAERTGDLVIAVILFCIGLFSIVAALWMPSGRFVATGFGSGLFPTILGSLLCVFAFTLFVQRLLHRTTPRKIELGYPAVWAIPLVLAVTGILFERLGFIVAIGFLVGFVLRVLSKLGWILIILSAIGAPIAAYFLFDVVLGIPLPSGKWP